MTAASDIRWWQRLSVRIAAIVAVALVAYEAVRDPLTNVFVQLWNLPSLAEGVEVVDAAWVTEQLLVDAERVAAGHWVPNADVVKQLGADSQFEGLAELWLTTDLRVVSAFGNATAWFLEGEAWPHDVRGLQMLPWEIDEVPATCAEIVVDGEPAGLLVSYLVDVEAHAAWLEVEVDELDDVASVFYADPATVYSSEVGYEAFVAKQERLTTLFSLALVMGIVVLLAWSVSRLVTRRLVALSTAALQRSDDGTRLPGPFVAEGRDEIAALATALNELRDRAAGTLDELEQNDVRRREWIAQVSHDLRTPLTALMACLSRAEPALARDNADAMRDSVRELIGIAQLDADRVLALADDLLDVARLDAADHLDLEPVPPGELARETVRGLTPFATNQGLSIVVHVEPALPLLEADGHRLTRALENLVRNSCRFGRTQIAVHARSVGGALLAAADVDAWLVPHPQPAVMFVVLDDGEGLPGDAGPVALEVLANRRRQGDSAGLGLTVARKVAEAHGGRLFAGNTHGGGAAVGFVVPVKPS